MMTMTRSRTVQASGLNVFYREAGESRAPKLLLLGGSCQHKHSLVALLGRGPRTRRHFRPGLTTMGFVDAVDRLTTRGTVDLRSDCEPDDAEGPSVVVFGVNETLLDLNTLCLLGNGFRARSTGATRSSRCCGPAPRETPDLTMCGPGKRRTISHVRLEKRKPK